MSILLLYFIFFWTFEIAFNLSIDCRFEKLSNVNNSDFCSWHTTTNNGENIWHTGNTVIVDSTHFFMPLTINSDNFTNLKNQFAYVQGKFGLLSEGIIESPIISDNLSNIKELKLLYWKVLPLPTLDICIKNTLHDSLYCIDSITGPGQDQWIQRSINLPPSKTPFKVNLNII